MFTRCEIEQMSETMPNLYDMALTRDDKIIGHRLYETGEIIRTVEGQYWLYDDVDGKYLFSLSERSYLNGGGTWYYSTDEERFEAAKLDGHPHIMFISTEGNALMTRLYPPSTFEGYMQNALLLYFILDVKEFVKYGNQLQTYRKKTIKEGTAHKEQLDDWDILYRFLNESDQRSYAQMTIDQLFSRGHSDEEVKMAASFTIDLNERYWHNRLPKKDIDI